MKKIIKYADNREKVWDTEAEALLSDIAIELEVFLENKDYCAGEQIKLDEFVETMRDISEERNALLNLLSKFNSITE